MHVCLQMHGPVCTGVCGHICGGQRLTLAVSLD